VFTTATEHTTLLRLATIAGEGAVSFQSSLAARFNILQAEIEAVKVPFEGGCGEDIEFGQNGSKGPLRKRLHWVQVRQKKTRVQGTLYNESCF
jgi:hypothetical protein